MNQNRIFFTLSFVMLLLFCSCSSSRKFKSSFPSTDSIVAGQGELDAALLDSVKNDLQILKNNRIDFRTFSAKLKVNYQDANGAQPEGNVLLRAYKDSAIWISLSGSILNLEIYRILITPDSVTILNKLDKTVEYLPFSYMEQFTHIPMDFSRLQDLLVGNPIYIGDSIVGYQPSEKTILIATTGNIFKNILGLSPETKLMQTSSLTQTNFLNGRTIHLFYGDYQALPVGLFSATREIMVDDESRLKIALNFKQQEFNKELSLTFNVPSNYKTK